MKIGIFSSPDKEIFSNECIQHAIFLYETLNKSQYIDCHIMINSDHTILDKKTINIYKNLNNLSTFDIIIFLSNKLVDIAILKNIKSQNIKIVHYNYSNEFYIYQEDIIFDKHNYITDIAYYSYFDEVWCIPNYKSDKHFYNTLYNINCKTVPYVWSNTIIKNQTGLNYDNKNITSPTKMLLICEPNTQITKTCLIPLLICEKLYNSGYCNIKILVLSRPETNAFKNLLENLNIYKNNLVELYPRLAYIDIIKQLKNKGHDLYLVSHHTDNPLNFLHLETLYWGYPLIHNCEYYKKSGYYYSNIKEGSEKLRYALDNHHSNMDNYTSEVKKTLYKFLPENNTSVYKHLLNSVLEITEDMFNLNNIQELKNYILYGKNAIKKNIYSGRGIVTAAGTKSRILQSIISVKILRDRGCDLPIELFYADSKEFTDEQQELYNNLNVKLINIQDTELFSNYNARNFSIKSIALYLSSFNETIWIDSDIIALSNFTDLFNNTQYKTVGYLFFNDIWSNQNPNVFSVKLENLFNIFGVFGKKFHQSELDSGIFIINKNKFKYLIEYILILNINHKLLYNICCYGDKDLFKLGIILETGDFISLKHYPVGIGNILKGETQDCLAGFCFLMKLSDKDICIHMNVVSIDIMKENIDIYWQYVNKIGTLGNQRIINPVLIQNNNSYEPFILVPPQIIILMDNDNLNNKIENINDNIIKIKKTLTKYYKEISKKI